MYWIYLLEVYLCIQDISRGVSMYTGCIYWKYIYSYQIYQHQKYTYIIIESRSQIDIGQILTRQILDRWRHRIDTGQILGQIKRVDIPIDEDIQQLKENIEVVQLDILKYRLNRLRYLIDRYQINRDVCQIQKRPLKQIKVPIDKDLNNWRRLQKEETKVYFR